MRIMLHELKKLIRNFLQEMPLADIFKSDYIEDDYDRDPEDKTIAAVSKKDDGRNVYNDKPHHVNHRSVEKYFGSPMFKQLAIKTYKFLSVPIYLVTQYTRNVNLRQRTEQGSAKLAQGILKSQKKEIKNALKAGAAVFVVQAEGLGNGFWPTPWMIIHAVYDNDIDFDKTKHKVASLAKSIEGKFQELSLTWNDVLTMKSARNKLIGETGDDAVAEMYCQAILTSTGFNFIKTGNQTVNDELLQIGEILSQARERFEKQIAGRVTKIGAAAL